MTIKKDYNIPAKCTHELLGLIKECCEKTELNKVELINGTLWEHLTIMLADLNTNESIEYVLEKRNGREFLKKRDKGGNGNG